MKNTEAKSPSEIAEEISWEISKEKKYEREFFIEKCKLFLKNDYTKYSIDSDGIAFFHKDCNVFRSHTDENRFIYGGDDEWGLKSAQVLDLRWLPKFGGLVVSGEILSERDLDEFITLVESTFL